MATQKTRESVWALSTSSTPFYRDGISPDKEEGTKWLQVEGVLDQLCVSISGTVWASINDKIHYRAGVTPNREQGTAWNPLEHSFSLAALEAGGSCLWAQGRDNVLYVRTGMGLHSNPTGAINVTRLGSGWTSTLPPTPPAPAPPGSGWTSTLPPTPPAGVSDMAITAKDDVFLLTEDRKLFKREGVTQSCPAGVSWGSCSLPRLGGSGLFGLGAAPAVLHIAGGLEHLWAVTDTHEVWRSPHSGVITERSWERIPGQKMVYTCPSMCDKEITWGINNRDHVFVRTSPQVGRYEWLRQGTIPFRVVSVGVMLNYTIPSEQAKPQLSRMLSQPDVRDLKVSELPFNLEKCGEMSGDLLAALVLPVLSQQEVLQRFTYDFITEETVLGSTVGQDPDI